MISENTVSLWLGKSKSSKKLEKYMQTKYSSKGDLIKSEFMEDFNIDFYEEDFIESEFYSNSVNDIQTLLLGFSYDDTIIEKFKDLLDEKILNKDINSVVLLYNFKYDGNIIDSHRKDFEFIYIGSTEYR